jgi:hypothetical protein
MSHDLVDWLADQGALFPTVRATGAAVPPPTPLESLPPSGPIEVTFDLSDPALQGQVTQSLLRSGVTMTLTAVGNGGLLDRSSTGVGVLSAEDPSGNATLARRIDGSLPTPESIRFSFDQEVTLDSIVVGAMHTGGAETLRLSLVSGEDPFAGVTGYSGDYQLSPGELAFSNSSGATGPQEIAFGLGAQDPIVIAAGTVLAITTQPSNGGGVLFNSITVQTAAASPGDFNQDGEVDGDDLAAWELNFGTAGLPYVAGDADGDDDVDGTDFLAWQRTVGGSVAATSVPEPGYCELIIAAASLGIAFGRGRR